MTKKHQHWTFGDKNDLTPYLDGDDDEIFEYAVLNRDFAIILKNDLTYDIKDSEQEAVDAINYIYRNYKIVQNTDRNCYIARENTEKTYYAPASAQDDGVFDYVYVPKDNFYLTKYGKIIAVGKTEDEMKEKMYEHYRAKYTYAF